MCAFGFPSLGHKAPRCSSVNILVACLRLDAHLKSRASEHKVTASDSLKPGPDPSRNCYSKMFEVCGATDITLLKKKQKTGSFAVALKQCILIGFARHRLLIIPAGLY